MTFVDQCDGTVSVEIVNPTGNGNIAVSYGVPDSFLSVFTSQTPSLTDFSDSAGVTLGTWIQASVAGRVHGIRWYFPATLPSSDPIGLLYSFTGVELARATFSSPVAGAWNEVLFSSPVGIGAGDYVMAAVYTPDSYVATTGLFSSSALTNGVLSAPATGASPPAPAGNGAYNYSGGDAGFPQDTSTARATSPTSCSPRAGSWKTMASRRSSSCRPGAGPISVTGAGLDLEHSWSQPRNCSAATVTFTDNCDGTVTVEVTNPAGNDDVTVSWTGGSEKVAGDGDVHTIDVPSSGGQITVTGVGLEQTHTWAEPDDCPAPTTPASETTTTAAPETTTTVAPAATTTTTTVAATGALPKTGSSLTGVLWAGAALLLAGIALVLFASDARSRRDHPTQA